MTTHSTLQRTAIGFALFGMLTLTGCGTDLPSGFVDDGVQTLAPTQPTEANETFEHLTFDGAQLEAVTHYEPTETN